MPLNFGRLFPSVGVQPQGPARGTPPTPSASRARPMLGGKGVIGGGGKGGKEKIGLGGKGLGKGGTKRHR